MNKSERIENAQRQVEIRTMSEALRWGDEQARAAEYWREWAECYRSMYAHERRLTAALIDTITQNAGG